MQDDDTLDAPKVLPEKSEPVYRLTFDKFKIWCQNKKGERSSDSETAILEYFMEKAKQLKPSTLWTEYSMLKKTLLVKENIDISTYYKVKAFLRKQSAGYTPSQSKILSRDQFCKYLREAPDSEHLFRKVAAIFGIAGACCREELININVKDIEDHTSHLFIKIRKSKHIKERTFILPGYLGGLNLLEIYRKYAALRPKGVVNPRFFLQYRNLKCTTQVVGVNTFGKLPSMIATYLELYDPNAYTGHCFKRSSATMLIDCSANLMAIKGHEAKRTKYTTDEELGNECAVFPATIVRSLSPFETLDDEDPLGIVDQPSSPISTATNKILIDISIEIDQLALSSFEIKSNSDCTISVKMVPPAT